MTKLSALPHDAGWKAQPLNGSAVFFHSLEVLLAGADIGLVSIHCHVYQFAEVSHSVGGQTEGGVLDGGDVSVPQDTRVCSKQKPTNVNWESCCGTVTGHSSGGWLIWRLQGDFCFLSTKADVCVIMCWLFILSGGCLCFPFFSIFNFTDALQFVAWLCCDRFSIILL